MRKFTFTILATFMAVAAMAQEPVTPPADLEQRSFKMTGTNYFFYYGVDELQAEPVNTTATVVIDGTDVYVKPLVPYYLPSAWAKGMLVDNVLTFEDQYVDTYSGFPLYLCGLSSIDSEEQVDLVFDYDPATYTFTARNILGNYSPSTGMLDWYGDLVLTDMNPPAEDGQLPAGVVAEEYTFTSSGALYNPSVSALSRNETAYVAFDGDDVYVSGLSYKYPEVYVKGVKGADGRVVFQSGQKAGTDDVAVYIVGMGANATGILSYKSEFSFDFDEETASLTLSAGSYIAESYSEAAISSLYTYMIAAEYKSFTATSVNSRLADDASATYYDLQGRRMAGSQKGLLIRQSVDAQGNVKTSKVVKK